MRLELTGRQAEITPVLRKKVEKKLAKLDRLLEGGIVSVQVVLTQEKYLRRAEISVHTRGEQFLHGISASNDWETSINDCVEKLVQQLRKVKGKWQERKRRATSVRTMPPAPPDGTVLPPERPRRSRVRRVPRYPVKPMSVDEAALVVEGGTDAFLVFRNASTDAINVVYRRKDGNLGLIEPED